MKQRACVSIVLAALATVAPADVFARGFGGAHAGGGLPGGGGGFAAGGMSAFHPTGFASSGGGGGFHPQENFAGAMGGYRPQGPAGGEMRAPEDFHAGNGLAGFHDYGGVRPGGIVGGSPAGLAGDVPLTAVPTPVHASGYDPVGAGGGYEVDRGGANAAGESQLDKFANLSVGGAGAIADLASDHVEEPLKMDSDTVREFDAEQSQLSAAINRGDIPKYISLPTDGGMSLGSTHAADHPDPAVQAPGRRSPDKAPSQSLSSVRPTPTYDHAGARTAQRWFDDHPVFTHDWLANHRQDLAWVPFLSSYDDWDNAFWESVAWATVGSWLAVPNGLVPQSYDYGNNVVYENGNVYVNSQPVGSTEQFYSQAQAIAVTGAGQDGAKNLPDQKGAKTEWLPLGVFALMRSDSDKPEMIFQLALSKQGIIRGNYFNHAEVKTQPVSGSVDKSTQRVAWHVGNNDKVIVETSIDNLTQDESSALVHLGPNQQERYVLVRLKTADRDASRPK